MNPLGTLVIQLAVNSYKGCKVTLVKIDTTDQDAGTDFAAFKQDNPGIPSRLLIATFQYKPIAIK
jgi:hypothetical protein